MRLRTIMTGKIHRATVTGADINYVGSITVDSALLEASDILPGEKVDVVNVTNGNRLSTYTIAAPAHSGVVQINGAAAHLVSPGDLVIIIAYSLFDEKESLPLPRVVFVDKDNKPISLDHSPGDLPHSDSGNKIALTTGLSGSEVPEISAKSLLANLNKYLVIDIRQTADYIRSHLPNAINIPAAKIAEEINSIKIQAQNLPVAICCYHGVSSKKAAQLLLTNGIDAKSVTGGYEQIETMQ